MALHFSCSWVSFKMYFTLSPRINRIPWHHRPQSEHEERPGVRRQCCTFSPPSPSIRAVAVVILFLQASAPSCSSCFSFMAESYSAYQMTPVYSWSFISLTNHECVK